MVLRTPTFMLLLSLATFAAGQTPTDATSQLPNSHPIYRQLRQVNIGSESSAVTNFVLKRDAGRFSFKTGTFHFLAPVEGKVTGAVFIGEGVFTLEPPNQS